MKNIINIFLFYFLTAFLNVWTVNGNAPDILWDVVIDYVETEEREREENAKYDTHENEKSFLKSGDGGGDIPDEIISEEIPPINIPLFNTLAPIVYDEEIALKQYQADLVNSFAIPKLYILFCCPKTFLS